MEKTVCVSSVVGKTWTELKRFWFARSDINTWVGAGETLESLPFSWLISTWERICDGGKGASRGHLYLDEPGWP
jgi:hypothetical protein